MAAERKNEVYLVAGAKSWNRTVFDRELSGRAGNWQLVQDPDELVARVAELEPGCVFFLHWSWKVPKSILGAAECIGFHMGDLPRGRGGSPLQNLIRRGERTTRLTAFRLSEELDAGPIYLQRELSLEGGAEEIYIRATRLSVSMIDEILRRRPEPRPQTGDATTYRRRSPSDSQIPAVASLPELFDFLRMLDAEGYPRAYLDHGGFRYRFHRPALYDGRVVASVTIQSKGEEES